MQMDSSTTPSRINIQNVKLLKKNAGSLIENGQKTCTGTS